VEKRRLSELVGQNLIRDKLSVIINIARQQSEALDHLLFCGSTGLGKTAMANAVANEMGVDIKVFSGTAIQRAGDMAAVLTNLRAGEILLIRHIENLSKAVIEPLIPAVGEFGVDIVIGKGPSARSIQLKLPRFTLIGTSPKLSQVDRGLRDLMLAYEFVPYETAEIKKIILSLTHQYDSEFDIDAVELLAEHCDGNPRRASILLGQINKYAQVYTANHVTRDAVKNALAVFGQNNHPSSK
jgi:holliday junction DNA helicase RuvB